MCDKTPVIIICDGNFDDIIGIILLAKIKEFIIKLIVINNGFGNIGTCIDNIYNILSWLHINNTLVVRGSSYSELEIEKGPYPNFYNIDLYKSGQLALPIFQQYIPCLWKDLSSSLYGSINKIKNNINNKNNNKFIFGYQHIKQILDKLDKKCYIINTSSLTDLYLFFKNYPNYNNKIKKIIIMGGGFYNFDNSKDNLNQRWAGNIFSDKSFYLNSTSKLPENYNYNLEDWKYKTPFRTMQEFNIFLDPLGAKYVFDYIYKKNIKCNIFPLDATDKILIGNNLDNLKCSKTLEGKFIYSIIKNIKKFEGDGFDNVIKLWDILAILSIISPKIINKKYNIKAIIQVNTNLDNINYMNILQSNPYIGKTTLIKNNKSFINVIFNINKQKVFKKIEKIINSNFRTATQKFNK